MQYNEILADMDGSMVSNANRREWEYHFQRLVLTPNLQVYLITPGIVYHNHTFHSSLYLSL